MISFAQFEQKWKKFARFLAFHPLNYLFFLGVALLVILSFFFIHRKRDTWSMLGNEFMLMEFTELGTDKVHTVLEIRIKEVDSLFTDEDIYEIVEVPKPLEPIIETETTEEDAPDLDYIPDQIVIERDAGLGVEEDTGIKYDVPYINLVLRKLQLYKYYPAKARRKGYEGTVKIRFVILSDGSVSEFEVLKECDFELLNEAALTTVADCVPFAPLEGNLKEYEVVASIQFQLD